MIGSRRPLRCEIDQAGDIRRSDAEFSERIRRGTSCAEFMADVEIASEKVCRVPFRAENGVEVVCSEMPSAGRRELHVSSCQAGDFTKVTEQGAA